EDVNHQHPWLTPGCRKAVASLGRLTTAVCAPRAHASTIEADADARASEWSIGSNGQTQSRLKCRIAQTGTGFRRGRGDPHQTRHVTSECASAEHLRGFEG